MSKRRSPFARVLHQIPTTAASVIRAAFSRGKSILRSRRGIPVEVVVADAPRRRAIQREVRRALGSDLPTDLVVVVQQTVTTDHPLAGCFQTHQRADGTRAHLVRLALHVEGRRLSTDDVLAALVDACVGIVVQAGGSSVLVPLGPSASPSTATVPFSAVSPDPLAPHPNGTISRSHVP